MKISTKIHILFLLFILAITFIVFIVFDYMVIPAHIKQMEKSAIDKAYYIQKVIPMLSLAEQQTLLEKLSLEEPDLAYMLILDQKGKALAHNNPQRVGMMFNDTSSMKGLRITKGIYKNLYIRDADDPSSPYYGERVVDIMIPYFNSQGIHIGAVDVGLSLQRIHEARISYYKMVGFLALFLSLLFWAIARYIFKEVIDPIKDISLATKGLREGKFHPVTSLERGDEIGDLARELDLTADQVLNSEKELRKQINSLNTLIDNINEFFYLCDLEGRLSFANKKSWQTFGYELNTALHMKMEEFVPELYREKLQVEIKTMLEKGSERIFEIPILYQDGRECLCRVHMSAIIEDGQITGGMALAEDISMYRLAQDSLLKAHNELEKRVKERTIELEKINDVLKTQIMERKQIEEALLTSEGNLRTQVDYLHTLINNLNELFFTYDVNGYVNFVNHRAFEVLGYRPEEYIGTNVLDAVPEEYRQGIKEQLKSRLEKGEDASYDIPFRHKNGSVRLMRLNGSPIVENGVVTGGMALCVDVTEYCQAEEALRISEEKFATAFRLSPAAININSMIDGRYIDVNDAWLHYSKYSREEVIGKTPKELNIILDPVILQQQKLLLKQNGFIRNLEIMYPDKEGQIRLGLCSMATLTINQELCILMVASDITERKAIEEDLAREKERLMVTLKSIGDGVVSTDTAGRITLVNEAAEKILAKKQDELLGKDFSPTLQALNPRFSKAKKADNAEFGAVDMGTPKLFYDMFVTLNGEERCIEANRAIIHDRDGAFAGVVWAIRDTTDKQKMEEELLKASKLDSLGVLAGGIAHDFNNLLTVIVGNLALGKMSLQPDDELHELLSEAEKASFQAKGLTQQLLTFARGGAPIRKTAVISDLLHDSARISLSGSNVIGNLQFGDDLWPVYIDAAQISQVFNNLIINAMQAMPEGGRIKISADNISVAEKEIAPLPAGKYVQITVEDEGSGIPDEIQARIFDPYFTTKPSGSGLGLATSYSIVRKHDGYITSRSKPGRGTIFYVYLPVSSEGLESDLYPQLIMLNGRGKILIMDDDAQVREVAGHILDSIGYQVHQASDGTGALMLYIQELEKDEKFDAVIIDLTVPGGMGGKETARQILQIDPLAKLIVSSGYSNDPIMANYEQWGFKGIIPKPYGVKELSETIARIVKE